MRALHYKRRILRRCVPPLLCFPHRQSYHLSCALLLWTDPGACGQRLFGSNVSVQSPFLETQGRSARGSESQLGDQGQCCRHREPCVTRNYPDLSVFLLCLPIFVCVFQFACLYLSACWSPFSLCPGPAFSLVFLSLSVPFFQLCLLASPCPFPSCPVSSGSACHFWLCWSVRGNSLRTEGRLSKARPWGLPEPDYRLTE